MVSADGGEKITSLMLMNNQVEENVAVQAEQPDASSSSDAHATDEVKKEIAHEDAIITVQDESSSASVDTKPEGKKKGPGLAPYFRAWKYATTLDWILRFCGFLAAVGAGTALPLMTIVFGNLVNEFNDLGTGAGVPEEIMGAISQYALYFLYLFIGKFFLVYIHTTAFTITSIRATKAIRQAFVQSLVSQEIAYFDDCSPGSVASTISNNADIVETGLAEKVGITIQVLAMLGSAFIVAFVSGWKLTLVTATILPFIFIAVAVTVSMDVKLEAKILKIYSEAGGLVEEAIGTIRIVTAFDASKKLRRKYDVHLEKAKKFGVKKGPILGVQYSCEFFAIFCGYALAFWYGIQLLLRGELDSGGHVLTILFAVIIGCTSMSMIAPAIGDFSKAAAAAKDIFEIIDRQSCINPLSDHGAQLKEVEGSLRLQNVSFAYPSRPTIKVLDDVTMDFAAGKVNAIVGASGSGKSTAVALIERWYDPETGAVLLDGHNVKDLNLRWLRSQIGLVQQEPVLFSDTIYANVVHGLYGTEKDNLPETEKRELVRQACIQAFADTFIQSLPEKYDTKVGDRGGMLSGGQKQRVAIARSIISDPRILLLDEATSALDPEAEKMVQAALDNVSKSRTTLMIAHKLSTVKKADKIIVMNRGKVVEQGTHRELLELKGAYHGLVNAQNLDTQPDNENSTPTEQEYVQPELELQKSATRTSIQTGLSALKEEDVSRKLSLFRCLLIIIREQAHQWPLFVLGGIGAIGGGAVFPAQAIVFSRMVTVFQLPPLEMESRGSFWALIYFVMALGVLCCYASIGFFFTVSAFRAVRFYRSEYLGAMLHQDIPYFDQDTNAAGALTSRLSTDPQRLQDLISANIGLIIIVLVDLFGCSILALAVAWKLGLVAIFGCLPPLFFAGFMRMRLDIQSQDKTKAIYHESARFAAEAVGAIRTVSSLTLEQKVLQSYKAKLGENSIKNFRRTLISMALFGLSESLDMVASGLAFWYGGKLVSAGEYTVQQFFVVFIAIIFGGQAAGVLFGFTQNTTKAHAAANHIIHLRRSQPDINSSTGRMEKPEAAAGVPAIEFRNVMFSYPTRPDHRVLRGLNLKIYQGQSIGIVGSSGCGKTTVISLLERFYDTISGEVLIHGTPLKHLDVHAHRSRMGLVSQDTTLYQGTLQENVLIGLPDRADDPLSSATTDSEKTKLSPEDEDLVKRACQSANIHDFIISLPDSYHTQAGTRGVSLSGGQRQRIAIARALIRDPEILLFDEATSALDTANERIVQSAIEAVSKDRADRTTISVAHRLSTVKNCDCIFVLHEGRVVEKGRHDELIRRKAMYYEMVLAQSLEGETA